MRYLRELWASRELLANLTMREIRGKYSRTVFGQLWSLANPLALMLIYTLVFSFILKVNPNPGNPSGLNVFALWLLCGLLPWTFFANVVNQGIGSLVDNANLIQKVYFTRIVLPLSLVGSSIYNWLFEMFVLLVALAAVGAFIWPWIPLMLVIMVLLAVFAAGVALMLSVANVYFRDTQYFLTIILQIWMYLSPIIYPISLVERESDKLGGILGTSITLSNIYDINPMVHYIAVFRNVLYDNKWPNPTDWLICVAWSAVALALGVFIFRRSETRMAELV